MPTDDRRGFAVVDLETTGLSPGWRNRIVEIAVVLLDPGGNAMGEWSTLVNPRRDIGPTSIHGLRPRDVVDAPVFADIAPDVAEILAGRVVVAHNLPFDLGFLRAEFAAIGYPDVPLSDNAGVCTMRLAPWYLPFAPRRLADCCTAAGWTHRDAHSALGDARSTAGLLGYYLARVDGSEPWLGLVDAAPSWRWPLIPRVPGARGALPRAVVAAERRRAELGADDTHFLGRLAPLLPRVPEPPEADTYLAVLDDALADRKVDAAEAELLVRIAADLGIGREIAIDLHRGYLRSLARAAWEDGVIDEGERADLEEVAVLLGLPVSAVAEAIESAAAFTPGERTPTGSIRVSPGDRVCFTGEMSVPRPDLEAAAIAAGLVVSRSVSGKTALLVCADADSESAKARRARELGTTVVSEPKFRQLLAAATSAAATEGVRPGERGTAGGTPTK